MIRTFCDTSRFHYTPRQASRAAPSTAAAPMAATLRAMCGALREGLAALGTGAVLLDDRHFLVAGFSREQLHTWYLTESDG